MYINSILPIHPCPHPALCPHVCTLHLCLYSSSADRLICTIFLDSTYIYYHLFLGFPHSSLVKNLPAMQFDSWVGKICWKRDRLPTPVFLDFPCGSAGKESACKAGDLGLIPGLGRSPGEAKGTHSSILAWSSSWGRKELERTELFHFLTFTFPHPRNVFIHLLLFLWLTPGGQSRHSFAVTPSRSPLPPNYTHFALYPVAASPLTLSS